jgi:hypothetical protein
LTDTIPSEKLNNILGKDFITSCGDVSRDPEDTWRTGLKLHSSEQAKPDSDAIQCTNNKHQMCMIINDTSEEVDNENNLVINPKRGANHIADGETESAAAGREKVHLSGEEWHMIKEAINHGATIPADSIREFLMGYQYMIVCVKHPVGNPKRKV